LKNRGHLLELFHENEAVPSRYPSREKEISTKEGIPTYAVFTNEQLAEIARKRPQEMSKLKEVEGVGESRLQKYGQLFLKQVKDEVQPADQ
jgi:superfamily II DNA helicase RecQ